MVNNMETGNTIIPGSSNKLTIVLVFVAVIVTVLNVLDVLPLITDRYFFQDDTKILYGVSSEDMPQGILTFTYVGWWRPIGFGLPMFINWLLGLSPLVFHILGLCIHFAVGVTLFWFARRLFSTQIAWLAAIFYLLSLNGISSVGFPINAFQDGLFTCFLLLGWGLMFPNAKKQDATPKLYLPSAIFILVAALCKDSWLGALPVILLSDWILVRNSKIKDRLKRLAPFLILIAVPVLRFVFLDFFVSAMFRYFRVGFYFANLLDGFMVSFLPVIGLYINQKWHYLLVLPVLVIMGTSLFSGFNRARIVLIILMFGSILLILWITFFSFFWIDIRVASLAALSAILLALGLTALSRLIKNDYLVSFLIILLSFAFYYFMSDIRIQFIRIMTGW
jgi:hypothetical protein